MDNEWQRIRQGAFNGSERDRQMFSDFLHWLAARPAEYNLLLIGADLGPSFQRFYRDNSGRREPPERRFPDL